MKGLLLGSIMLACLSLGSTACGGDDDDDGGGGCANAQMACKDDPDAMIDCSEFDSAPAGIKDCASKATTCDAVLQCFISGG